MSSKKNKKKNKDKTPQKVDGISEEDGKAVTPVKDT